MNTPDTPIPEWTPAINGYHYPIDPIDPGRLALEHPYTHEAHGIHPAFRLRGKPVWIDFEGKPPFWQLDVVQLGSPEGGDYRTLQRGSLVECSLALELFTVKASSTPLEISLLVRKLEIEAHRHGWSLNTSPLGSQLVKGSYVFYTVPAHLETPDFGQDSNA